ncbi:MAG TPA: PAS domain-containing sensor histidine kinase [Sunxiuqinia sp.]|nr:PAS domain-containing sensor histidine kinase [Sunxiuqinia sp.]
MNEIDQPNDNQLLEENRQLKEELQHLKQQNLILTQLTNKPNILAWMVNTKLELIYFSPAFAQKYYQLTGIELELYKNAGDFFRAKYKKIWEQRLRNALKGESLEVEEYLDRDEGNEYFRIHISALKINHKIIGVQVIAEEITGLKKAEKNELINLIKLREIFNQIQDLYYETDLDGKITELNPAIETISKYKREDLIGTSSTFLYQEEADRQHLLNEIKKKGTIKNYQLRFKDKNGELRNLTVSASLIRDQLGVPVKIVGILRDLTEIEQKNKDLRWLRRAIEQSPMSIIITDMTGKIEYSNPFFTLMTGYSKEEVLGQYPSILKSDQHSEAFYKDLWQTIQHGETWSGEFQNKRKDGRIFTEKAIISPVINNEGKIVNFIALKEDITAAQKTSEEVKRLKSFNDRIISTMHEGIVVEDDDGKITFINPAFSAMTGFTENEVINKCWETVIDGSLHERILTQQQETTGEHRNFIESQLKCKDGSLLPVIASGSPIMDGRKQMGMISVYTNITRLKENEIKLKEALEKAQLSDKLKSSFLANMSHEIRTPMNAIIGFADILRQEKDLDDETREEYFSIIEKKGNELLQIISDLIDVSKIETQSVVLHHEKIMANDFLNDVYKTFLNELQISSKPHLGTQIILPENSESITFEADHYRLRQVFTNLLDNAFKFTRKGQITVGYRVNDNAVKFFVSDTGIGISPKDQLIIFDRFRQADNSYTRQFRGTGLGLNICKSLIKMMGGTMWVESAISEGTTFYFTLPFERSV